MAKFALLFCIILIVVIQIANTSAGRVVRDANTPITFDTVKATVQDIFSDDNINAGKAKAAEFGENVANVFRDLTDKATETLKKLK